ncbi:myo-inositol 2-dehydrogenase/D-chiro-inositol 1-dehydrogenase [Sphaerotilus hippei]|uniref:Myo-inositol 2-dehydrogenase/D-chiro-inositol 1-dehydrogenase n=1 Tax=Sphaerotilus hippei TaxID=744406 RepID=A0A318H7W1_9BURK|nr:Gfo/Idh/MocA family oxidoreductase [Sphaerotilus hippei]PXW93987.1 myo-inositol 2-dehydrogenase/D-chiro-inositol 1-dehydrogenase [Sphaerotilus hippei]
MSHSPSSSCAAPLRVGIVGLGRLGRRHAEALAFATRHVQLVAACSPVESEREFARGELGVPRIHADYEALLQDPEVDAVVLVTPTSLHADQTIAALRAGKHVFVEKPLALNVEDCERVLAVAAEHPDRVAMVGFVRRFDPSYQSAQASVAAGEIGRPFLVRSQTCDRNDPDGFFVRFAPTSGGIFMDCSVHDIDLARWLLGRPKALRAFASGTIALHPGLAECGDVDNGLAIVEFEGGARAVFYASRTMAHGHETSTEVIGTEGKLLVGEHAARDRVVRSDARGVGHAVLADFHERFEAAFSREMIAFVAACRGEQTLDLTLSDAVEATRIGVAITRSLISGQVAPV